MDDGDNSSMVETNITVMPLADNRPVINPDGDPTMTENMGPVSIIYDITDADQLDEHQLIHQINISLHNASGNVHNEVSDTKCYGVLLTLTYLSYGLARRYVLILYTVVTQYLSLQDYMNF